MYCIFISLKQFTVNLLDVLRNRTIKRNNFTNIDRGRFGPSYEKDLDHIEKFIPCFEQTIQDICLYKQIWYLVHTRYKSSLKIFYTFGYKI